MAVIRSVGKTKKKKLFVKSGFVWLCGGGEKVSTPAMDFKKSQTVFRTGLLKVQTMGQFLDLSGI